MMRQLNARQRAFVDIYTNPQSRGFGNATKAAELAGYSRKTAGPIGRRLLPVGALHTGSSYPGPELVHRDE